MLINNKPSKCVRIRSYLRCLYH